MFLGTRENFIIFRDRIEESLKGRISISARAEHENKKRNQY